MRIVRVEAFEFRRVLDGSAWNPVSRWHERRAPLLRITGEDGVAGIGEGWSDQARIAAFFTRARAAAAGLLGRNAREAFAFDPEDWPAAAVASAVDMALWDMRARGAGLPLHRALGARDDAAPVYASGGLYADGKDAAALAAEMDEYRRRGFTAFKMKIGALGLAGDMERVGAARAAIGPDAELIVDAVGQLTAETAPAWMARLRAHGVRALQAPLPPDDVAGLATLQRAGLLDIVAQETEFRPAGFERLLDRRAVGWLQINPGLAGGFSGVLALIARAAAAGVPVTLQCHATAVLQAACLHLAACGTGVRSAEFHMFHDHLHDLLPRAMTRLHQGRVMIGNEPGLGIPPGCLDQPRRSPGTISRIFGLPD
jgi:L-alanine-DL-glutamate epimerase-like enolase superfamily enzyme